MAHNLHRRYTSSDLARLGVERVVAPPVETVFPRAALQAAVDSSRACRGACVLLVYDECEVKISVPRSVSAEDVITEHLPALTQAREARARYRVTGPIRI